MMLRTVILCGLLSVSNAFILTELRCCPCGGLKIQKDGSISCIKALLPQIDMNNIHTVKINETTANEPEHFFLSKSFDRCAKVQCLESMPNDSNSTTCDNQKNYEKPDSCVEIVFDERTKSASLANFIVTNVTSTEIVESNQKSEKIQIKKCCKNRSYISVQTLECKEMEDLQGEFDTQLTEFPEYYEDLPVNWPENNENVVFIRPNHIMTKDEHPEKMIQCIQDSRYGKIEYFAMYFMNGASQRFTTMALIFAPIILSLSFF